MAGRLCSGAVTGASGRLAHQWDAGAPEATAHSHPPPSEIRLLPGKNFLKGPSLCGVAFCPHLPSLCGVDWGHLPSLCGVGLPSLCGVDFRFSRQRLSRQRGGVFRAG
jgi:hypothetical protein